MIRLQLFQSLLYALVGVEELHLSIADNLQPALYTVQMIQLGAGSPTQLLDGLPGPADVAIGAFDFLAYFLPTLVDKLLQFAHPSDDGSKAALSLLVQLFLEGLKTLLQ
ncbi:hypothetical protein ColKHC_12625 [Colletotrichum higginsianum]|nr:hypothetical protein ColKHC_12625 [Colletotrichum higginsianum]